MVSGHREGTTNTSNIADDCRHDPRPAARILSGGFRRPCSRRLLAFVADAPSPATTSAPQISATSAAVSSPSARCDRRADDRPTRCLPATSEWAGADDGWKPDGHVAADPGGMARRRCSRGRRGRLQRATGPGCTRVIPLRRTRRDHRSVVPAVTRDDYTDPTAALEGNYRQSIGRPRDRRWYWNSTDEQAATHYFELYRRSGRVLHHHRNEPVRHQDPLGPQRAGRPPYLSRQQVDRDRRTEWPTDHTLIILE